MQMRSLGGAEVSEVGLGTWQLGAGWGRVTDEDALATLHAAADAGATFIDTADVYGYGRSEERIGRFLSERGERFFIATKIGRNKPLAGPETHTLQTYEAHCRASLARLGLERADLLQLHTIPGDALRSGRPLEHLQALRDKGLTRFVGASVETEEEALFCLERGVDAVQIIFNIFRQKPLEALFDRAKEAGAAVIARVPLASGLLSGKLHAGTTYAKNDHRRFNRDGRYFNVGETFAGLPYEKGLELADRLRTLRPKGMTMAQTALRFALDFPAVSVVIPGARKPAQAAENAAASGSPPLSPALHARLREFYENEVRPHIRGAL